ncbi:MAG: DUF6069 family protein [Actinomycetota bacterium]|nr:hypothetical protein [Nocardioidaceae bacterium]MDQ3591555.1 DUF6069 family protein [Actinomycetota bacterium]
MTEQQLEPAPPWTLPAATGWKAGVISTVLALAANLAALAVATVAGAKMVVQPAGATEAMTVGAWLAIVTTVVPLALGTVLLVLLRARGPKGWRMLASVGLAIGILTVVMPLTTTASAGTKTALAFMHVATGLIWYLVVRRAAAQEPPA